MIMTVGGTNNLSTYDTPRKISGNIKGNISTQAGSMDASTYWEENHWEKTKPKVIGHGRKIQCGCNHDSKD